MARSCLFRRNKFAACLTAGTLLFPIAALTAPGDVDGRWSSVQITGEIITAAYHPEEGLWVAGSFENFSTSSQLNLTRLCPNGFRDTSAVPFIGTPISVIQMLPDRRLLLASADSTKLQKSSGSGNSGLDVGFAAAAPSAVNLVGVTPNREFLAGRSVAPWLVKISAAGAVNPNYVTDLAAPVLSLAVLPDGSCLAGGRSAGGPGFLTKISPAGMTDSVFATAFDGPVQTLVVQPDAKILVGGRFQTVNGAPRTGLVRLLPDGSVDASFLASLTGAPGIISVKTLLPQVDGAVLVSGTFTAVDGTSRPGMARLTVSGTLDRGFSHLDTARYGNDINLLTLMPDGRVVADVTGAPGKRLVILLENGAGSSSLDLTQPDEITWSRSGSLPELSQVWFEMIQTDTSGNILPEGTPLGLGVRTSGGWKLTSPNLPTSGVVRAVGIGPSACGQSSGSLVFDTLSLATTVGRMSLRRLDSPIPTTAVTSLDFIAVWRGQGFRARSCKSLISY